MLPRPAQIVEPYTSVEVSHVAGMLNLPVELVQQKLAQMILDKKLRATLDQGAGCLEIFDSGESDQLLQLSTDIFQARPRACMCRMACASCTARQQAHPPTAPAEHRAGRRHAVCADEENRGMSYSPLTRAPCRVHMGVQS